MSVRTGQLLVIGWSLLGLGHLAQAQATDQAGEHGQVNYVAPVIGSTQEAPVAPTTQAPDQQETTPPIEQRRHFSRSIRVTKVGQPFFLDTRYGRVRVSTWDKPEIKVEADLIARAETPVAATELLDGLSVQWLDYDARTGGVTVATPYGCQILRLCTSRLRLLT